MKLETPRQQLSRDNYAYICGFLGDLASLCQAACVCKASYLSRVPNSPLSWSR